MAAKIFLWEGIQDVNNFTSLLVQIIPCSLPTVPFISMDCLQNRKEPVEKKENPAPGLAGDGADSTTREVKHPEVTSANSARRRILSLCCTIILPWRGGLGEDFAAVNQGHSFPQGQISPRDLEEFGSHPLTLYPACGVGMTWEFQKRGFGG